MSWGCPGMLKSSSELDVVSNRWESIRFLFRGYIPLGARDITTFEIPKQIKPLPLIADLPKPSWLWTWFRNTGLRIVVAGCRLHYFICARLVCFELLRIFSTIDRSIFYTYENSYNGA